LSGAFYSQMYSHVLLLHSGRDIPKIQLSSECLMSRLCLGVKIKSSGDISFTEIKDTAMIFSFVLQEQAEQTKRGAQGHAIIFQNKACRQSYF
jgi:hypothetical protein